jgi:hypothetical protein
MAMAAPDLVHIAPHCPHKGICHLSSPVKLISTTDDSAIRLGHAATSAGLPIGLDAKPTRMRHLCKNMQKVVQNTATHLLTIIGISDPSLSGSSNVPEGRFGRIQVTYHKIIPVQ